MSLARHGYSLFGLSIESEIELPELAENEGTFEPDVHVRLGTISAGPGGGGLAAHDGALLLTINGVARYLITGGSEIIVEPDPKVDPRNVRLFLLGSAFGALVHQRRLLPLHANAIEIEGKAVAFMGPSGAGKSTLAAWFEDRGYQVLTDDVCVVDFSADEQPAVRPGIGRLRLWREAVQNRGASPTDYQPSFVGDAAIDKFDIPLTRPPGSNLRLPLVSVYLLDRGAVTAIAPLRGMRAFEAVSANTYRGQYIGVAGSITDHWSAGVELVKRVPLYHAERRWGLRQLEAECKRLLDHALEVIGRR